MLRVAFVLRSTEVIPVFCDLLCLVLAALYCIALFLLLLACVCCLCLSLCSCCILLKCFQDFGSMLAVSLCLPAFLFLCVSVFCCFVITCSLSWLCSAATASLPLLGRCVAASSFAICHGAFLFFVPPCIYVRINLSVSFLCQILL